METWYTKIFDSFSNGTGTMLPAGKLLDVRNEEPGLVNFEIDGLVVPDADMKAVLSSSG